MYQNIHIRKKDNHCWLWDDQKGLVEFDFKPYVFRKNSRGKYTSLYGDKLEKTIHYNPHDPELFESDVPLETMILRDAYEDSDEPSKGHRVVFFDIETSTEGGFPNIDKGDKEITAIALYDSPSKKYHALILDKDGKLSEKEDEKVKVVPFNNEKSLLSYFLNLWDQLSPTIVSGWNIDFFDCPYLYNRLKVVFDPEEAKRLSPIRICYYNPFKKRMNIAGISCLDYILLYKKFRGKQRPTYQLGEIGKTEVKMDKIRYKGDLNMLYKEDIEKYIRYNLNDVEIVVALDQKFQYIELAREICHIGHIPYEQFHMSSRYLEGAILMYLRRQKLVAPNKPEKEPDDYDGSDVDDDDTEESFEGAYVKAPIPGRYDWVYDLDLASMYPNIIISLNISPETKVAKLEGWDVEQYMSGELKSVKMGLSEMPIEKFKTFINENKLGISSNGVLYRRDPKGVIPVLLDAWFKQRVEMRKLVKKYHNENNKELKEFYDRKQYAWKILLNSMYGTLGLPVFRFYDRDNAEAVTKTGVTIIQTTGKLINMYYQKVTGENEDYVIYQDTDSCFVSAVPIVKKENPDIDVNNVEQMTKAILNVADRVQTFINGAYDVMARKMFNIETHAFVIKQEVIATTGFWLAKKRYAQWIINNAGLPVDELEVKGIDVVRTSFPIKFRSFLEELLRMVLAKKPKDQIDEKILEFKKNIKTFGVVDLAKNTSVKFKSMDGSSDYNPKSRKLFQLIPKTPAQAKAALMYNDLIHKFGLQNKVEPIMTGSKIKWVYLKKNEYNINALAFKADQTDPDEIMKVIETYIDREALYEHELKSKLEDFYSVLKWQFPTEEGKNMSQFFEFSE